MTDAEIREGLSEVVVPDDADESYVPAGYLVPVGDDSQVDEAHVEVALQ